MITPRDKMTIYIPTNEQIGHISSTALNTDKTLNGKTASLDEIALVEWNTLMAMVFPDENIDSTFRKLIEMSLIRQMPVQIVTHYYPNKRLKGSADGKAESLGAHTYQPSPFSNEEGKGEIDIFMTSISTTGTDNRIYVISYPYFIGRLNPKSLLTSVKNFPSPEFNNSIKNKRDIAYFLRLANEEVLAKLGMVSGYCHPCPSDKLVTELKLDVQIVMNANSISKHRIRPYLKADVPIDFSRYLAPTQEVSFQINYGHLYELLSDIFPGRVKAVKI